ncbi:MAG: S41 family peptidase [bacterium]|nr:S41 family peptidase [bacterium]
MHSESDSFRHRDCLRGAAERLALADSGDAFLLPLTASADQKQYNSENLMASAALDVIGKNSVIVEAALPATPKFANAPKQTKFAEFEAALDARWKETPFPESEYDAVVAWFVRRNPEHAKGVADISARGCLHALDRQSFLLDDDQFSKLRFSNTSQLLGLITHQTRMVGQVITHIAPDSPAQKAGLEIGDRILGIQKEIVLLDTPREFQARLETALAAPAPVPFVIRTREGRLRTASLAPRPAKQAEKSSACLVDFEFVEATGIGYLRICHFSERISGEINRAVIEHYDKVEGKIRGLVVDLRGNPGGQLSPAVELADLFLPKLLPLARTKSKLKDEVTYSATDPIIRGDIPIAIWMNAHTYGSAEIFAAAMRSNRRAALIGDRSAGVTGIYQIALLRFPDRNGNQTRHYLKHRVSEYLTADGESLNDSGLPVDLTVQANTNAFRQAKLWLEDFETLFPSVNPEPSAWIRKIVKTSGLKLLRTEDSGQINAKDLERLFKAIRANSKIETKPEAN